MREFIRLNYEPGSYWSMIFYHDEVTPGNIAAPQNLRKFVGFYFSFREFGNDLLQHGCMWMRFGVLRTKDVIDKLPGRFSRVCGVVLDHMLRNGENFVTSGVAITVGRGNSIIFHANLTNNFGDLDGLRKEFDAKNDSGTRPCMLCRKTLRKGQLTNPDYCIELDESFVEIDCLNESKFALATDETVWNAMDTLCREWDGWRGSQQGFDEIEQANGFNCNPMGLLMRLELRPLVKPVSTYTVDWPHIYVCQGVGGVDLYQLVRVMRSVGIRFEALREFCEPFVFPGHERKKGLKVLELFSEGREDTAKSCWKSDASEFFMVAPLIQYFCQTVLVLFAHLEAQRHSFELVCKVIDLLQAIKRGRVSPVRKAARLLREAVIEHFTAYQAAYGSDAVKSKHHKAMHLWLQLLRDLFLMDSLPLERDHKVPKRVGTVMANKVIWEKSVIIRDLAAQFNAQRNLVVSSGLRGKQEWTDMFGGAWVGGEMYHCGMHIHIGDFILFHGVAILVR